MDRHTVGKERCALGAGRNIRRIREKRAYDQAELARLAGITASALWKIENEDRTPRGPTIRKIAEILGVTPAQLKQPEPEADDG